MTLTLDRVEANPSLGGAADEALALAHARGDVVLLSVARPLVRQPDPLHFLRHASGALGGGILWSQPSGPSFAGVGSALTLTGSGADRFHAIAEVIGDLRGRLICAGDLAPFPILGGFAFSNSACKSGLWSDFPDARLIVPNVLLQQIGGATVLRTTVPVAPGMVPDAVREQLAVLSLRAQSWLTPEGPSAVDHLAADRPQVLHRSVPDRKSWEASVAEAVSLIKRGSIDKVVLAREERIETPRPWAALDTLDRLRAADPTATLFAMQAGASWFVGASPERLVRLDKGRVDVTCLAGSIGIGDTNTEQAALARQLLASAKDRHEHEIVVESTMAALREICDEVYRETGTPRVAVARSVQHLETPVSGYLPAGGQVLELVARLHPTPAVGGFPRDRALDVLHQLEQIDRGWYAGPFGWTDLDGSGEFSVAIRSALLNGTTASVFAGCGIVGDSDPAAEFAETCLKMSPMLSALGVS